MKTWNTVKIAVRALRRNVMRSTLTGVQRRGGGFFSLYPARKAAQLDPIGALRYE